MRYRKVIFSDGSYALKADAPTQGFVVQGFAGNKIVQQIIELTEDEYNQVKAEQAIQSPDSLLQ